MGYKNPDAQREYQRRWMADRRADALRGQSCAYCAATADLHFHHFDPENKVDHKVWSWSPGRRDAELAKCIVLCRGCHQRHHADRRPRFCQRGHEFTEENSYIKPSTGRRECRQCKADRRQKAAA